MTPQKKEMVIPNLLNKILLSISPRLLLYLGVSLVPYLVSHRKAFEKFVYTSLIEAHKELDRRWKMDIKDTENIPTVMKDGFKAVMFRQVVTPNYEIIRFINLHDDKLKPVFFEYHQDKFTTQSYEKHALGKLRFFQGIGKKGGAKIDRLKVIDFQASDGKKLSEVGTLWGQPLVDFHKEIFLFWNKKNREVEFFDASQWFSENGGKAEKYYESFLRNFLKHGIWFENFVLEFEKERNFTGRVFLPAFIKIWKETGLKPLIVSLAPTSIEGDEFWMCHESVVKEFVEKKLSGSTH